MRMSGPMRAEAIKTRKLRYEEFHNLFSVSNVSRINSRRMRSVWHTGHKGEKKYAHRSFGWETLRKVTILKI
jgi:hypothetical protein